MFKYYKIRTNKKQPFFSNKYFLNFNFWIITILQYQNLPTWKTHLEKSIYRTNSFILHIRRRKERSVATTQRALPLPRPFRNSHRKNPRTPRNPPNSNLQTPETLPPYFRDARGPNSSKTGLVLARPTQAASPVRERPPRHEEVHRRLRRLRGPARGHRQLERWPGSRRRWNSARKSGGRSKDRGYRSTPLTHFVFIVRSIIIARSCLFWVVLMFFCGA